MWCTTVKISASGLQAFRKLVFPCTCDDNFSDDHMTQTIFNCRMDFFVPAHRCTNPVELSPTLAYSFVSMEEHSIILLMISLLSFCKMFVRELSKRMCADDRWYTRYNFQSNRKRYRAVLFLFLDNYYSMIIWFLFFKR